MKILITGAYGQLGSEIKALTEKYKTWQFLFTDADVLDITDENAINIYFRQNQPDFVINCAAYTAVDKAESDAETAEKVNALAPKLLAKYSGITGSKLIHISTDYVFNGESFVPYTEEDKVNPAGVYGKTKLQGEINCFEENPGSLVIRTSWLYSTFGNNFVKTMLRLAGERDKLNVVFDQVGTPTNAADLAGAILSIIQISEKDNGKFVPGIYHYSNEGVASWYDFAKAIFETTGVKCEVSPVLSDQFPTPAKRPNYSVLNKSKIKNTFGLTIPYWKESLTICLEKINK
ncbi:MAG TPA: dTDP-4-dehydrorhamnose reductase [Draconibacterium sp.]|nr:dTDP-4-dehydrorhamnose reductase [Draconibacterium sp.]HRX11560.1 dTDP-4-dehydrorhamnose reductase [Draconibacterium sp.]